MFFFQSYAHIIRRLYATAPVHRKPNNGSKGTHVDGDILNFSDIYKCAKEKFETKKLPLDINETGVFACNELNLNDVIVYGFDYDYTLAVYKKSLNVLLYNLGRDKLVDQYKYPTAIKELEYTPNWPVRGLHYDIEKGVLLKLDSYLQIQLGSVYRGQTRLEDAEVMELYKNRIIPLAYVESHRTSRQPMRMVQLADQFSVCEMTLLSTVAQYMLSSEIDYHPEMLFRDIQSSISESHPIMHGKVLENFPEYLEANPKLVEFLDRLVDSKKLLFLVTNSPFEFVNQGMTILVGPNWREYFDVIIVSARKPRFFTDATRPIREYDEHTKSRLWHEVTRLERGHIYCEGNGTQLQEMMGWSGNSVLYFGDHPFTDLAEVMLEYGWRTAAIIHELKHEIKTLNRPAFKYNANWQQRLTQLIEDHDQYKDSEEGRKALALWAEERDQLAMSKRKLFNAQFGSVFRCFHTPTYFSRRLFRFSDIYTSNLVNLMSYSVSHTFYPRRGVMPHEYSSYFV